MKYTLTALLIIISSAASNAQLFDKIKKKAEKAAEKTVDRVLSGEKDPAGDPDNDGETTGSTPARATINPVFDFVPGDSLVFRDDLSGDQPGSMPHAWKSNGSGEVVRFPGVAGNWLLLKEFASYKLDTLLAMPAHFSLEFDILTRSDQARDLVEFSFGFASDNSVRRYISDAYNDNAITQTTIHYWNKEVISSSSDTKIHHTGDFELENYANETMHVSIRVAGENMAVYLDKKKVLDTRMFDPGAKKYFYMSTGTELNNDAQIAVSNFDLKEYNVPGK